jgi:hypothetical protein
VWLNRSAFYLALLVSYKREHALFYVLFPPVEPLVLYPVEFVDFSVNVYVICGGRSLPLFFDG